MLCADQVRTERIFNLTKYLSYWKITLNIPLESAIFVWVPHNVEVEESSTPEQEGQKEAARTVLKT